MKKFFLLILIILSVVLSSSVSAALSNSQVIQYYNFDNNILDQKASYDLSGTTNYDNTTKLLGAASTKNHANTLTGATSIASGSDFSISCWVYKASADAIEFLNFEGGQLLFMYTNGWWIRIRPNGGNYVGPSSDSTNIGNGWHNIVVTYAASGTSFIPYVDTTSLGTVNLGSNPITFDDLWFRTADGASISNLDECAIFNVALSTDEVSELYNSGSGKAYPYDVPPDPNATFNLTTTAITWPILNFSVNVSINNEWDEQPNCTIIDNVSWVSCSPASIIMPSANSTSFNCGAVERNIGDVSFHANCTSTLNTEVSETVIKTITADSSPDIATNLTGNPTIENHNLEGFIVNITGLNWTEQPTCTLIFNDTGITCLNTPLYSTELSTGITYLNVTTCTPDTYQEKDYSVGVNCNGINYLNINSSVNYTFSLNASIIPTLSTNLSSFDTIFTTNKAIDWTINVSINPGWDEQPICSIQDNQSWFSCIPVTEVMPSANWTSFNCSATAGNDGVVNLFANCTSTLNNINSSSVTWTIETINLNDDLQLYLQFNNSLNDSSINKFNSSYYIYGIAGYDFRLNQNSNDVFGSLDATVERNVSYDANGLYFNGTSRVEIDGMDTPFWNGTTAFTWSAWIKPDAQQGGNLCAHIMGTSNLRYEMLCVADNKTFRAMFTDDSGAQIVTDTTIINDSRWHHVAANVDYSRVGNEIQLWVDGINTKNGTTAGTYFDYLDPQFDLGANQNYDPIYAYNGYIQSIGLYNKSLSNEEMYFLYKEGNYTLDQDNNMNSSISFSKINESVYTKASAELITNNNTFTFSTWFNSRSIDAAQDSQRIITTHRGAGLGSAVALSTGFSNQLIFDYMNSSTNFHRINITTIDLNSWYHFAVTYNGTDFKVYVDGILNATITGTFFGFGTYPTVIGAAQFNALTYDGLIDNVRIYNRTLTLEEIELIYDSEKTISISSNLTSDSLTWPTLNFSVNVSINSNWDEQPNCTIIDNVSWVNCSPSSIMMPGANSTSFNCGATERNTGDVSFHANCTSTLNTRDSTTVIKSITADSNPLVTTNLSTTELNNYTTRYFSFIINGTNWSEQPTCGSILNVTKVRCPGITLDATGDSTGVTHNGTMTCEVIESSQEYYNLTINCNSTTYTNYNSTSYLLYVDTMIDATVSTNLTAAAITWPTLNFSVNVSISSYWDEQPNCTVIDNVSWVSCTPSSIIMPSDNWTSFNCGATEKNTGDVSFYANCTSTLNTEVSTTVIKLITADSNPLVTTNLSTTESNNFTTQYFDFIIRGYNWSEQPTCAGIFNNTNVTCSDIVLGSTGLATNETYNGTMSCEVLNTTNEYYNLTVNCNSTKYINYNSTSYLLYVNKSLDAGVSTNLTTTPINWTTNNNLNWTVNVSINQYWDEQPTCTMIDNVSWVNCTPTSTLILSTNWTNFNCTAYERNTGDVELYAQCNSSGNLYVNSTSVIKSIIADSIPNIVTNLTGDPTIIDYNLEGFLVNITGINWTEQSTCALIINDTGLTCSQFILSISDSNVTNCTPDYVQTKDYNISVNCNGSLYLNINSTDSYKISVDADSNPDVITNISRSYNNILTNSFDVNMLGLNWTETPTCALVWNDSGVTCGGIVLNATGNVTGATYSGNLTCNPDYQQIKTYNVSVNCNSTLYSNINSSASYLVTLNDTISPYFMNNSDNSTVYSPQIGEAIQLNLTINDVYNVSVCRLMLNDSNSGVWQNRSIFNLDVRFQYNLSMNYTITSNSTKNHSHIGWRVWCNDSLGNANVSDVYTFDVKDITFPLITLGDNNGFNTGNTTVVSGLLYSMTYNITFADFNLFEAEVNVTCSLNGQIYYWKQLDWNETTLNKTDTINLTGYLPQRCTFFTQASDDHTANKIGDYEINNLEDGVEFKTENNINIKVKSKEKEKYKKVKTVKKTDRYEFNFEFNEKDTDRTFVVEADQIMYPRENSGYDGHFVIWSEETHSGNWIDFEEEENDKEYVITKIDDKQYEIEVKTIIPDEDKNKSKEEKIDKHGSKNIKFKSVGGTNITNATYYFFIGGVINVSAFNIYDNTTISTYNLTIKSVSAYPGLNQSYNINTYNTLIENISNGTYTFLFNRTNFYNLTYNVNVSNITQWLNYSAFQSVLNIILQDVKTGTVLTGGNITWENLNNLPFNNTYINNTLKTVFYVNASDYQLTVDKLDYDQFVENHTITALTNTTITVSYSPLVTFYLYDEKTLDLFNVSSPDSISFLLICPSETTTTIIDNTSAPIIPLTCNYTSFRFILEWLPGETITGVTSYFRSFLLDVSDTYQQDIFLIDLADTEEVTSNLILDDLLQDYDSPSIFVKKTIGGEAVQITADYTDIENKIVATLIKNNEYIIEVHSTNNPDRVMGSYIANSGDDKTLRLYDIDLDPTIGTFAGNLTYNMWITNTSGDMFVRGWVQDLSNITKNSTFTVRETTYNGPILYYAQSTSNNITWEYNISSNLNRTIFARIDIDRPSGAFGDVVYSKLMWEVTQLTLGIMNMNYYGATFMNWFFIIFLGVLAIMATIKTANYVSIMLIGLGSLFVLFGWFGISAGILTIYDLLQHEIEELYITGISFYDRQTVKVKNNKIYRSGYARRILSKTACLKHDVKKEMKFFVKLCKNDKRIVCDDVLNKIVKNNW